MMENINILPIHADYSNGTTMEFLVGEMNALARTQYQDNFGFYQQQFGIFSYMQMTKDKKYRLHYVDGQPLVIQAHNSCAWTPSGELTFRSKELETNRLKVNIEGCIDEYFGSAFDGYYEYAMNPSMVRYSELGEAAMQEMIRNYQVHTTLGLRATMTAGQLFDTNIELLEGTSVSLEVGFRRQVASMQGWMKLAQESASQTGRGHLDTDVLTAADISDDGLTIKDTVSILDKFDQLKAASRPQLRRGLTIKGVSAGYRVNTSIALVSYSVIEALSREYDAIRQGVQLQDSRIKKTEYQFAGPRGQQSISVFSIDDTVFIPLDEVSTFTRHLPLEAHFMYLTMAGVIQMGGNFAEIPLPGRSDIGLVIERGTTIRDAGLYRIGAHILAATAINDLDYLTGTYVEAAVTDAGAGV